MKLKLPEGIIRTHVSSIHPSISYLYIRELWISCKHKPGTLVKRDFKQGRLLWDFDCSSETRLFVAVIENKILSRDLNNTSPFSMVKDLETISTSFLFVKSFRYEVTVSMEANNSSAFFSWMLLWEDFFGDLFYGSWKHIVYKRLIHTMPAQCLWH